MGIDPAIDRPVYQQVADLLRERITSGTLAPGARLPSESELMDELDISRTTARLAYGVLRTQGLVVSHRGRGVYVRDQPPVRRVASTRYRTTLEATRARGPETAFTIDQGINWSDYRLDREFEDVPAAGLVAELLGIDEGAPLLARHLVFYADGKPQQASTSYLLADMVRDTPIADPANEPWPGGTIAQLASLGIEVTVVSETVSARMPEPMERQRLHIAEGVPVLCVTRVMLAGDRPVEAAVDIVMPADRFKLDYTIPLTDP